MIPFLTGDLLTAPRRVGKPLRRVIDGLWGARRGIFRVMYRMDEDNQEIVVLRVDLDATSTGGR